MSGRKESSSCQYGRDDPGDGTGWGDRNRWKSHISMVVKKPNSLAYSCSRDTHFF